MSYPSEYQLAKKSYQLGLALLQEPSNTIILQDFLAFNHLPVIS